MKTGSPKARDVQRLVSWVMETEHKYLMHGNRRDDVFLPFMSYQPADFLGIMWDCLERSPGAVFLDVGCGPGTKMRIAQDLFGLISRGIEIDPVMTEEAKAHGTVHAGNALTAPLAQFAVADIIWLYRPFRDAAQELALEQRVRDAMKPGAILAGGSWESPAPDSWLTVVDDCLHAPDGIGKIFRGAWMKTPGN